MDPGSGAYREDGSFGSYDRSAIAQPPPLTTVSPLLHNGFTRPYLSQFHNDIGIPGRRGGGAYREDKGVMYTGMTERKVVLKVQQSLVNCKSLRTFSPAVPDLPGDEIATSRGIFKPHFAMVLTYVEVKDFGGC